jgi:predicted PurR-regulated permease PerM
MNTAATPDITRTTLVVLIIGILIAGSLWTLLPFIGALVWATTIVVATWPLMLKVQHLARGKRSAAAALIAIAMLTIFTVPFALAIGALLDAAKEGIELVRAVTTRGLPPPPAWVEGVPWAGPRLAARWQEWVAAGPDAITEALRPYVRSTAGWAIAITGGFAGVVIHFLLTVVIAAVLYTNGEVAARGVLMFAHRIGGERGERSIRLAGQSIRGVALGVIVTALVQSIIAGIGLWLAGVPRPGLLLAVVFVLSVAQLGPLPVLIPAIIWLFWSGKPGWAALLIVTAVIVMIVDNVMKPLLIKRGVDLPLLLIISGVIGGLISFGVVGLFIGPVILAVTFTLLDSWVKEGLAERAPAT